MAGRTDAIKNLHGFRSEIDGVLYVISTVQSAKNSHWRIDLNYQGISTRLSTTGSSPGRNGSLHAARDIEKSISRLENIPTHHRLILDHEIMSKLDPRDHKKHMSVEKFTEILEDAGYAINIDFTEGKELVFIGNGENFSLIDLPRAANGKEASFSLEVVKSIFGDLNVPEVLECLKRGVPLNKPLFEFMVEALSSSRTAAKDSSLTW